MFGEWFETDFASCLCIYNFASYGEIIDLTPNYLTEINCKHQEVGYGFIFFQLKEGNEDAVYISLFTNALN